MEVQGVWEELNLKLGVHLKGMGMNAKRADGKPYFVSLFCEGELCPVEFAAPVTTIDEAFCKQRSGCRISVTSQLSNSRQAVSERVLAFLHDKEMLCMMGNSIRVEAEWLRGMTASGCQAALEDRIMRALPSPAVPRDLKDVASGVSRLKNGRAFMFASHDSQNTCNVFAE